MSRLSVALHLAIYKYELGEEKENKETEAGRKHGTDIETDRNEGRRINILILTDGDEF